MGRKLGRILLGIVLLEIVGFIVSQIVAKKLTKGDETSDDFHIAAIMGGKKFESHARDLKSGSAVASMGGIQLDLRDATLGSDGAELELKTTLGGVQVLVRDDWAVEVEQEGQGGFEVDVTAPEDLPDNAPRLRIHAINRLGGGQVTTKG
jgi:hypothetical protein